MDALMVMNPNNPSFFQSKPFIETVYGNLLGMDKVEVKKKASALWPERALTPTASPMGQAKHAWQRVPCPLHPVNSEVKVLDCGMATPPTFCSILIYLCDKMHCIH